MIAPAMNTGPEDRRSYRELARQQVRIQRSIDLQHLSRLQALVDAESDRNPRVAVDIEFHVDSEGLPWVTGTVQVELDLLCLRCAEVVDHPLSAAVNLCIVNEDETDAAELSRLAEDRDLLVVTSPTLDLAEVVEDELLLAMPERLCSSDPCERMPALDYPIAGSEYVEVEPANAAERLEQADDQTGSPQRENPFAVLAELLDPDAVDGAKTDSKK
jgi:uncharacterized protein